MIVRFPVACLVVLSVLLSLAASSQPTGQSADPNPPPKSQRSPLARIVWLEAPGDNRQDRGELPVYREIDAGDPRLKEYERWIDTEAGRFARRLVYRAAQRFGSDPVFREPVLPIVVRKGGNNPGYGLTIRRSGGLEAHPGLPYIILDPSPTYIGDTLLHESGHLVHSLAVTGQGRDRPWSAFPHTTFATSDPTTALSEGYGIHFETLWGHFGGDPAKQAYYRRLAPSFAADKGRKAYYFMQVDDLMNFAQTWSRYQAVRDGLPAFEGHVYAGPDGYARGQMDPARDCARLKPANAMVASEGVVASVFFWTVVGIATEHGARAGDGFDQPAIIDAEMRLLEALAAVPAPETRGFRPDVIDVVDALKRTDTHDGDIAIARLVDITHGVTARPALRDSWRALYGAAIMLDLDTAKTLVGKLDAERSDLIAKAHDDPASLRAGVGPVVPVRVRQSAFQLKALGAQKPVEFDLNAMGDGELALLKGLDAEGRTRLERERDRAPFASSSDFTARTRLSLERLGLVEVKVDSK
jgi:hypothetical protein